MAPTERHTKDALNGAPGKGQLVALTKVLAALALVRRTNANSPHAYSCKRPKRAALVPKFAKCELTEVVDAPLRS